jgi:phenylacetate-CoA ligase
MIYNKFVRNIYFPLTEFVKGESVRKYLSSLQASQYYSRDELREIQWKKLKNLLDHAYLNIPYYRNLFNKNGIHPNDIKSPEDFSRIPRLTKETIVEHYSEIADTKYRGNIYSGKTSGSTGIPLKFYCTPEYSSWDWASRWRARSWYGVQIGDPEVAIWGRPLYSTINRFRDSIKARIRNTLLISAFEFSEENLYQLSKKIIKFDPIYIYGYSASIFQLALYAKENYNPSIFSNLKAIFVTAETLFPYQRNIVEQTFGAPVSNEYGCSEIGGFAYECPHGNWHISSENVYVEFISVNGGPKEIVATSLTNYYMPFIRYRIGDLGEAVDKICTCGRNLPMMKLRTGKATEVVYLKNGKTFSGEIFDYLNLALLDKKQQPFKQFQITQKSESNFEIKFIKGLDFTENSLNLFKKLFLDVVKDNSINLKYSEVEKIPKDQSGKIRYFISEIKK